MKFEVGDRVRVVSDPYLDCPFHWDGGMDKFCGQTCLVTECWLSSSKRCYAYHIRPTDGIDTGFIWCENCLEPAVEEPDPVDISDTELDAILF